MRREFPSLYARISNWVATPLIIVTAIVYLGRALEKPASDFFPIGLAAFGLTAGLAGLCFTMTPSIRAGRMLATLRYSGEKFFHAALLFIQVLILVFVRDSLREMSWIGSSSLLSTVVVGLLQGFTGLVRAAAAWSWYWAFDQLNTELWLNWRHRIDEINRG